MWATKLFANCNVICNLLCWIMYDLGCMLVGLKSFMVSSDYRVYMGSSITVRSLWWLLLYLCSYKLDGSVTLVLHALQDSKCLLWNFRQLKNRIVWNISLFFFSQINWRNVLRFLKTKHSLPSPFLALLVYVVFLDPH
jgi:hypothetical protein